MNGDRRLILLAQGLQHKSGHHYMEARAFKEEAEKQGERAVILSHVETPDLIRDELKAIPTFSHNPYMRPEISSLYWRWKYNRRYVRSMETALQSTPINPISSSDVIISTLTKARDIMALASWLKKVPAQNHPLLALNFMVDDLTKCVGKDGGAISIVSAGYYRHAFNRLKRTIRPDRISLTTGGPTFSETMSRVLGQPVQVSPLPVELTFADSEIKRSEGNQVPVLAFLGHMQSRKGAGIIGPAIRRVVECNSNCRFVLQANPETYGMAWREEIGDAGLLKVDIHHGEMSQSAYQSLFKRSDIILLPYIAQNYRMQTSGIYAEAMAAGKMAVISSGTWMEEMANQQGGGAIVYDEQTPESLAEAILKSLEEWPMFLKNAGATSSYWREEMGMAAYVKKIREAHA